MRPAIILPVTSWAERTSRSLREHGYRTGGAREAVIELLGTEHCCSTAQELHDRLRQRGRRVGLASVYRALELLTELGLAKRIDVGEGTARYEAAHLEEHHHHVVCDDCGRIESFEDAPLERAIAAIEQRLGYAIAMHEVVLRGACDDCRGATA
jgi:Fur family transcriptional regulator, ferric uptake regulator